MQPRAVCLTRKGGPIDVSAKVPAKMMFHVVDKRTLFCFDGILLGSYKFPIGREPQAGSERQVCANLAARREKLTSAAPEH
jgi:hypothetical protein